MTGNAAVSGSLFAGLSLLQPERYISFLYRAAPERLEANMATVATEERFHKLLDTGLFERDRRIFESLHPTDDAVVVVAGVSDVVTAVDGLLFQGYATCVLALPSLFGSPNIEAERRQALLLWICRQASIRDGLKAIGAPSRHAVVIAYSGEPAHELGEHLFRPAHLAAHRLKTLAIIFLTFFPREALHAYITECRAHSINVALSVGD